MLTNVVCVSLFGYHLNSQTDVTKYSSVSVKTEVIYARRGYIFDRNGNVIAEDSVSYNMYAILDTSRPGYGDIPAYVPEESKTEYATKIATILGIDPAIILSYLQQSGVYQTEFGNYGRNLDKATKEAIEALNLYGIEFNEQNSRNYPLGTFASHLVGYARYSHEDDVLVGEMGIESLLNDYLLGKNGYSRYNVDANGYMILGTQSAYVAATNGNNVYLTIDKTCQQALNVLIQEIVNQFSAEKMWGGVMEVETGKMLAWDCYPSFDPNTLSITNYLDLGSQYPYEPGSTMKTFTYAATIDYGTYDYTATYDSGNFYVGYDNGKIYRSTKRTDFGTVYNSKEADLGRITYAQAYYRSLNTGIASLITNYISPSILEDYLNRFGFFKEVDTLGVDDIAGVKNMDYPIDQLATGYGQSSSVTALEMMQAYSAIMNEGEMVKPYFIDYIEDSYTNKVIYQGKKNVVGNPISASSAQQVLDLMRGSVTDQKYGLTGVYSLPNVEIVAKTGTGQIGTSSGYDENRVTSSVVIGLPYNDPKILIYLCFQANYNNNMNYRVDSTKRFMQKLIQYLHLSDSTQTSETTQEITTIDPTTKYENVMPSLVNHSLEYSLSTLKAYNTQNIVLGNGDNVIAQYPSGQASVTQNQRVFLLTSNDHFTMPDMTGWSRKDVAVFWELTGIAVDIDGYGYVSSQSITAGTSIDANSTLKVVLSS